MAEAPANPNDPVELGREWMKRIRAVETDQAVKAWMDDAQEAERIYLQDDAGASGKLFDFNILHSNIETIGPSLYNSTPIPDIRERFRTGPVNPETSVSRVVSQIIERAILVQIDDGRLDVEMEDVVQDALLAGRGIPRVRFDADVTEQPAQPVVDPMSGQPIVDAMGQAIDPMTGQPLPPVQVVTNERLIFEAVSWRDYREGPAMRWRDVPWVAFRHCIPQADVDRIRDPALKAQLDGAGTGEEATGEDQGVHVWEIWDRETRCVYRVADASCEMLSQAPDPLGLSGFFPCVRPIQPITASGKRTPVVPFKVYRKLADELEGITKRIAKITDGLRVRGIIVGEAGDIERLATLGDNELMPMANLEALAQTGGLDKAITWWPVEQAVKVLQQLYLARAEIKATIYEVTGISDIVRGASQASETATAQRIKSEWGSLRIKKLQRQVERAVRDIFVMSAEIIGSKFSPETLQRMSGVALPPEAGQLLGKPLDHYRIDVESDSTVRADLTRKRTEMNDFLTGTATFFGTVAPIAAEQPELKAPLAEIYAAFARQFSLGKQAEDALERMIAMAGQAAQQPKPEATDPLKEAQARKADADAMQTHTETVLMGGPLLPGQPIPPQAAVMAGAQGKGPLAQAMNPQQPPAM